MKISVLSDIHGNLRALEAIIRTFRLRSVDKIICLGDIGDMPVQCSYRYGYVLRDLSENFIPLSEVLAK